MFLSICEVAPGNTGVKTFCVSLAKVSILPNHGSCSAVTRQLLPATEKYNWGREMAHAVKCLFCNHEDRCLIPRTHLKKKKSGYGGMHLES